MHWFGWYLHLEMPLHHPNWIVEEAGRCTVLSSKRKIMGNRFVNHLLIFIGKMFQWEKEGHSDQQGKIQHPSSSCLFPVFPMALDGPALDGLSRQQKRKAYILGDPVSSSLGQLFYNTDSNINSNNSISAHVSCTWGCVCRLCEWGNWILCRKCLHWHSIAIFFQKHQIG